MLDPQKYVFAESLRDGTPVTLRAFRADGGVRIRRAFRKFEPETIYTRFLATRRTFPMQS
jgi:hypothetical protein